MNQVDARRELRNAWAAPVIDYKRIAHATAVLLELCDYNLSAYRGLRVVKNEERE